VNKLLTKTDFVSAFICPTRLNYIRFPYQFTDSTEEDEYLQSLSDGGYQIGKLAQLNFKNGIEVSEDSSIALNETNELMSKDNVIIFEAAIQFQNFFIRVDIVRKKDKVIDLVEVKAKSYDSALPEEDNFYTQKGLIKSEWKEYFYDLAFQYYVVKDKYPDYKIKCFFNLPNKNIDSKVNNLFSKFSIKNKKAFFLGAEDDLIDPLIYEVNVTDKIEEIIQSTFEFKNQEVLFGEVANELALAKINGASFKPLISNECKTCKFKDEDKDKSGIYHCWKTLTDFTDDKFESEKVIDLWNFRGSQKLIDQDKYFIEALSLDDLKIEKEPALTEAALSMKDRHYFQCFGIDTYKNQEGYLFNSKFLDQEISKWKYPLNFIDFETATPAIPPYKGLSPYEMIAFQYSIHTLTEDGVVEHTSQFLSTSASEFPNFAFLKNLVNDLSKNSGSVFMWHYHERTTLESIQKQILKLKMAEEYQVELDFLQTLLEGGEREIIDLLAVCRDGVFYPNIKGSNSIKKILPAAIYHSKFLQHKYSKPIYGSINGIKSLNYEDIIWVKENNDGYRDPYDTITDYSDEAINHGGMAATTFAKLQFEDLTDTQRKTLQDALLRYCELDTLAMVMIVESWLDQLRNEK